MLKQKKHNTGYLLITGATSTLGKEIARRRAHKERLLLHGRNHEDLERLATELRQITDVKTWCRDFEIVEGIHDELLEVLTEQRIQVIRVVHAAGKHKILPFRAFKTSDTQSIFCVNVFSIIEILRVLTRKPQRDILRSVVLVSALFSKVGDKGNAVYSSSKGALNSIVKSLAVEFPGTRFNSLILGAVKTRMTEHLFLEKFDDKKFERYLLGIGEPFVVTDAVDFLLRDDLWMTGQEMFLDGGASIS
jgi:NAD(P)-dependent dehydrogenase (short-subunit alcohol dehydrogenase family)